MTFHLFVFLVWSLVKCRQSCKLLLPTSPLISYKYLPNQKSSESKHLCSYNTTFGPAPFISSLNQIVLQSHHSFIHSYYFFSSNIRFSQHIILLRRHKSWLKLFMLRILSVSSTPDLHKKRRQTQRDCDRELEVESRVASWAYHHAQP